MRMTKNMWWIVGGIGVAGSIVGGYFLFVKKKKSKSISFNGIGHSNTSIKVKGGGQATPVEEPNWNNPFDMNYIKDVKRWLQGKRILELSPEVASRYALILKNAKGLINDDEDAVAKIFKKLLKDKTQVASLSKAFYRNYKRDMWEHLRSFLSDRELNELVHRPVKQLANYRLA